MRYVHNIRMTAFVKPEEYSIELKKRIEDIFHTLAPLDFEKERIAVNEETVESFENRKIRIYSLELSKEAHTNVFLKKLKESLKAQCKTILDQRWSRLDDELFFYVRLDKDAALKDVYELTDSGDCIHIKMHIAAFPKNKDTALKVVEEIFR